MSARDELVPRGRGAVDVILGQHARGGPEPERVDQTGGDAVRSTSASRSHLRAHVAVDSTLLGRSAALLLCGQLLHILVTQFHVGGRANDHEEIFAAYARSESWRAVHVGQFLAMAVLVAGLLLLALALRGAVERAASAAALGGVSAVVALTLHGVLQAVDGVGNQETDRAWVDAPEAEQAARFASAEAMRWLEWGVRSYHDYALGLALLLLAAAVLAGTTLSRAVGCLMGLSGAAYLLQGWTVGHEGFSATHTGLILAAWGLSLVWMSWLVVVTQRRHSSPEPRSVR